MGFSDFFRKKTVEELFREAVKERNYLKIVSYGKELISKGEINTSVINQYVDALIRIGNKEQAVAFLINYAEEKLKNGYYSSAIAFLKKALKYDPYNIKAAKLLSNAYVKKNLYFEAFNVFLGLLKEFLKEGRDASKLKEQIEYFIDKHSHPTFYKLYGEILESYGYLEEAYKNYMMAGSMFASLSKYREAIDCYLRAREIKQSDVVDTKISEIVPKVEDSNFRYKILKGLVLSNQQNVDFIHNAVREFINNGNVDDVDKVILSLKDPKLKWVVSVLRDIEVGEIEEAFETIENILKIDASLAEKLKGKLLAKHPEAMDYEFEKPVSDIPSSEDILSSLFSVVDEGEDEDADEELLRLDETEESKYSVSDSEIAQTSGRLNGSIHKISMAEAMLGLGNYEKAVALAKECLEYPEVRFRAISLIASAYSFMGKHSDALSFLIDSLKNYSLKPEEERNIKETIAKIYEEIGDKPKAAFWYREAGLVS
ncbi:tetratricopeptide repeat protein [Desulfurobacterium atlanticum]|uniref:Tetratricopeptide repeat-containing protein n=1 Tax=Desulfurobacterium atlanticum TaxID=240169 RepID=A0A238ZIS8_9BACT|nr:hypothetical protein [Desulfurobacterium atlanticum]SNR82613.1 Tetratricopeptide repeat-containing protein [Desulfurobacterium atlanticum]